MLTWGLSHCTSKIKDELIFVLPLTTHKFYFDNGWNEGV